MNQLERGKDGMGRLVLKEHPCEFEFGI